MKCATQGCPNQDHEGQFEGAFCCACTHALRSGRAGNGSAWIHRQAQQLEKAETLIRAAVAEANGSSELYGAMLNFLRETKQP